ncbi:flippase-like domain-containing protein [candidate division WOR-3 bacterium]|nr:flippase-like domain-containing protein [candidate division WOR-3 bacterium]
MTPQSYSKRSSLSRSSIIKGLKIFIALCIATFTLLLVFTATNKTWDSFREINLVYLPIVLFMLSLYLIFESFRIRLIAKAISGKWIAFGRCTQVIFCGAFLSAVTPFQAGGSPLQAYVLNKAGLKWGTALLLLLFRGLFYLIGMLIFLPFILPFFRTEYPGRSMQILSRYSIFAYLFLFSLLFLVLSMPKLLKKMIYSLTFRKGKTTRATRIIFRVLRELKLIRNKLLEFIKNKKLYALAIIFTTIIVYIPNYSIAYFILKGLSIDVPYLETIFRQVFLLFAAFFFPTPGAEGIIEGGFAVLFYSSIPRYLIGMFAILWRFITYHLIVIIGGILTLRIMNLKEIVSEKN